MPQKSVTYQSESLYDTLAVASVQEGPTQELSNSSVNHLPPPPPPPPPPPGMTSQSAEGLNLLYKINNLVLYYYLSCIVVFVRF